jgi:hypothetical protein
MSQERSIGQELLSSPASTLRQLSLQKIHLLGQVPGSGKRFFPNPGSQIHISDSLKFLGKSTIILSILAKKNFLPVQK